MKTKIKINERKLNGIIREATKKVLNERASMSPIRIWNYWCTNFTYDFIDRAWADDKILAEHLKKKFDYYYNKVGSFGVMTKFYLELDSTNQKILEEYVLNNYMG